MAATNEDPVLGINDIKDEPMKREKTRDREETGRDMAPPVGSSIHRSGSRPQLDLSGAAIQGNFEERNPTILLPNQSDDISHLAIDIGGEFIKLLWFIAFVR